MPEIATRLLPLPLLALLLAAAGAGAVLLYRRERALVPRRAGRWLATSRCALVLLLLALLADPVKVARERVLERGDLLVVIDASRSFSLADPRRPQAQVEAEAAALGAAPGEVREASRRDLAARALASGWLDELGRRFDLSLFALAGELRPFAAGAPPPAGGPVTDLTRPIAEEVARRRRGGEDIAGAVLFTDGAHNAEGDPCDAALQLALLGVPLVVVGVGALERPAGLRIESVDATGRTFAGDEVKAQVVIASSELPAMEVKVDVLDDGRELKSFAATIPAGNGSTPMPLAFPAGSAGRRKLTVRVQATGGAWTGADSKDLWIEVLSGKARVLLLDGAPRWEHRYLREALSRDVSVELHEHLVTPPPERRLPAGFPRTRDELFAHDVVVLGDVDPAVFTREEVEALRDFVAARGGSIVAIAGERSMPYRWAETPLAEVLPVELLRPAPSGTAGAAAPGEALVLTLTRAGEGSALTRLVPGRERNLELWEMLPAPQWVCPVKGLRPGAEALATVKGDPERRVVLATRAMGAGRVLFAGADATWRWRFRLGDELHRRFWGQAVRWAVSRRLSAEDEHARLGTDAAVYAAPARVTIEALLKARAAGDGGAGAEDEPVDAVITRLADGKQGRARLEPVPSSGGRYRAEVSLAEIGLAPAAAPAGPGGAPAQDAPVEHRVRLDVPAIPGYSAREDRASVAFALEPAPDREAEAAACDVRLAEEVAAAAGGRFLPLARFREAAELLAEKGRETERVSRSSPWDRPALLAAVLLGLLVSEWILRRRVSLT
ncbi:MAG: hypothetical protein HY721_30290 [Planctomycetes bacterium]|nr:hypothetical protein [Planctomycetota bacterium]